MFHDNTMKLSNDTRFLRDILSYSRQTYGVEGIFSRSKFFIAEFSRLFKKKDTFGKRENRVKRILILSNDVFRAYVHAATSKSQR